MIIFPGYATGIIPLLDSTPVAVGMTDKSMVKYPCTVTLFVTAGDTLTFEQSFDGGLTYVLEATITATQSFVLTSGCSNIRVTRTAGSSTTSYFTVN